MAVAGERGTYTELLPRNAAAFACDSLLREGDSARLAAHSARAEAAVLEA